MAKNALKKSISSLILLFFISCAINPSYTRENIDKVIKKICKDEFNIDVNAWITGDTVWIYAPFSKLIKEKQPQEGQKQDSQEKYKVRDLDFSLSPNHLIVNLDVLLNPLEITPAPDEKRSASGDLDEKATEDLRRIFLSLQRALLNMDSPPKFYCFIAADTEKFGMDWYTVTFTPDMIQLYMNRISEKERQQRTVSFNLLNPQALGDSVGKHIQPYDINPDEFIALLIMQNIRNKFANPDGEKLILPIDLAEKEITKVLDIYSSLHALSAITVKDIFNGKTRTLNFALSKEQSNRQYVQPEIKKTLANLYKISIYLSEAYQLYLKGDFERAKKLCGKSLDIDPGYSPALTFLGTIYNNLNQPEEAITYFSKALQKNPNDILTYQNMGLSYIALEQYEEALAQFKKAMELKPDNPDIYYLMGMAYSKSGQHTVALDYYKRVLEINSNYPGIYSAIGLLYQSLGNYTEAIANYEKALLYLDKAKDSKSSLLSVYASMGETYRLMGNSNEAINNFQKILALDPDSGPARLGLANTYLLLGQHELAIAEYKKALPLNPESSEIYINLALAHNELGLAESDPSQYEQAIAYLKKALKISPDNSKVYYRLGETYANAGKNYEAVEYFEEALKLNPDSAESYFGLGRAWHALGQNQKAKENFLKAHQFFYARKDYINAQKAEENLRNIPD